MNVIDPMTNRTEHVGVRLTPDEYDKFEDYIESSNEFDSMSRFFRVIAHRTVATDDEEDVSIDADEIIDAVDTVVSPIADRLEQVEEHVVSIDSNVRDDDMIDRLARDIYATLPTHSDASGLPALDELGRYESASDLAIAQAVSTPEVWAEYYDENLQDSRRAVARMQEYYPDVQIYRDETASEDQIQLHDDVDVSHTPSHTDQFASGSSTSVSSGSTEDRSGTTVRRYFKTSGD